jgi:hypothetical protein
MKGVATDLGIGEPAAVDTLPPSRRGGRLGPGRGRAGVQGRRPLALVERGVARRRGDAHVCERAAAGRTARGAGHAGLPRAGARAGAGPPPALFRPRGRGRRGLLRAGGDEAEDDGGRDLELGVGDEDVGQPALLVRREERGAVVLVGEVVEDVDEGVAGDGGRAIGVDGVFGVGDEGLVELLGDVRDELALPDAWGELRRRGVQGLADVTSVGSASGSIVKSAYAQCWVAPGWSTVSASWSCACVCECGEGRAERVEATSTANARAKKFGGPGLRSLGVVCTPFLGPQNRDRLNGPSHDSLCLLSLVLISLTYTVVKTNSVAQKKLSYCVRRSKSQSNRGVRIWKARAHDRASGQGVPAPASAPSSSELVHRGRPSPWACTPVLDLDVLESLHYRIISHDYMLLCDVVRPTVSICWPHPCTRRT